MKSHLSSVHSFIAHNISLKTRPARFFALLGLIGIGAAAVAATSSASVRQFILGTASGSKMTRAARPKAAATDPLLTSATVNAVDGSSMTVERRGHTATRLSDGRVLIAGGENSNGVLSQSEIYDPAVATFAATGNLNAARADHSATLLSDGRVLIAGGRNSAGAINTTEIFDPTTGVFTPGPDMSVARAGHSATLFTDGRVFIAGGDENGSAEIFDPSTGAFSALGANLTGARSKHSAALLSDGRVLIVGGQGTAGGALSSGEIFDPATSSFTGVGGMEVTRVHPLLRVLFDGKVQIIGGADDRSLEIYDPVAGIFGGYAQVPPDGDLHPALIDEIMVAPTRSALLTGGRTLTELGNSALAAGGDDANGNASNAVTFYQSSGASVSSDLLDYPPGQAAVITGRGFQPGENVTLTFHEYPHVDTAELHTFTVQADGEGNFTFNGYAPEAADLGITYILGAKGESSGRTAQTTFHDAVNLNILGSDNAQHQNSGSEENLGSIPQGTSVTLTCPRPTGLGVKAAGLGGSSTQAWSIAYGTGAGSAANNATLSPLTTLTPNSGTVTGSSDTACVAMTITTASLTEGTTYHGSLKATGSGAGDGDYFFRFAVISGCAAPTSATLTPGSQTLKVGDTLTLNATATGGTAPYNFVYKQGASTVATHNNVNSTTDSYTKTNIGTGDAGSYTVEITSSGCTGSGTATSSAASVTVNKRTASIAISFGANPIIYGGNTTAIATVTDNDTGTPITPTGTVTFSSDSSDNFSSTTCSLVAGVLGTASCNVTVTPTHASVHNISGSWPGDSAHGAPANGSSGLTVNPKTVTANITVSNKTYDGNTSATITACTLSGTVPGDTTTEVDCSFGSATGNFTDANAGPGKTVNATGLTLTGSKATSYSFDGTASTTANINKADASFTVTPYNVTYDGLPHTATVSTITGVNGETGATVGTVNVSNTTHTNAGTYNADYWFFTGTANYNNIGNTTITDQIDKADATFTVTPYDVTYDGLEHTAAVSTITGVNGETGATVGTVDVSNTQHTNAGTYSSDSWSFTGAANYNNQGPTTITDKINKADATFTVTPYDVTYDGLEHTATVSTITGVNGETGATVGTVDVSNTKHTNAGTYSSDSWSFTGTANYNNQGPTTITDKINKADASFTVTPYNVTYDGLPHTATVSTITGVNGETGATVGAVNVSNTTHTNAATYSSDTWSFTGTANYNNQGPTTITDKINKRETLTTVSSSLNPSIFGQNVSFTATVVGTGAGAGNPSGGSVQFMIDGSNFGLPVALVGGSATSGVTSTLTPGNHTVDAVFTSSDTNFNGSTGSLTGGQQVGAWTITGFYQPVDMPIPLMVLNVVKGGSTVPLKFNIYAGTPGPTTEKKSVSDVMFGSVQVASYDCNAAPAYDNPMDVPNTGATALRYDTTGGQFIQNWQTPKPPNKCYQVRMTALDGSHIDAFFKTK